MKYLLILGLLFTACEAESRTKEELLTKIQELEKIVQKMSPSESRWKAEYNETYYTIYSGGNVYESFFVKYHEDLRRLNSGNMFKDKATAQHYAKKRAARQRLELLALALNGEIVEFATHTNKYILIGSRGKISVYAISSMNSGEVLFKTRALAERAIDLTSKEDLTTLFGSKK